MLVTNLMSLIFSLNAVIHLLVLLEEDEGHQWSHLDTDCGKHQCLYKVSWLFILKVAGTFYQNQKYQNIMVTQ